MIKLYKITIYFVLKDIHIITWEQKCTDQIAYQPNKINYHFLKKSIRQEGGKQNKTQLPMDQGRYGETIGLKIIHCISKEGMEMKDKRTKEKPP